MVGFLSPRGGGFQDDLGVRKWNFFFFIFLRMGMDGVGKWGEDECEKGFGKKRSFSNHISFFWIHFFLISWEGNPISENEIPQHDNSPPSSRSDPLLQINNST